MASGSARIRSSVCNEGGVPVAIGEVSQSRPNGVPLSLVLGITEVAPAVLLLELLEALGQSSPLATDLRDLGGLEPVAKLGPGLLDDAGREDGFGDRFEHRRLGVIRWAAPGSTAERRAAVVPAFGPALEVGFAAHPSPTRAVDETAEEVVAEWVRLVAGPSAGGDRGDRPVVLGNRQDRLVATDPFIPTPLLDDEAEVHPPPPEDVLDRLPGPGPAVGNTLTEELGDLGQ
jgi:hypothetical protein